MLGKVSVAAVADLVLFDAENPRSLVYQLERLRADLKALPGIVRIVAARAAGRRDRHPAAPPRPRRPRRRHRRRHARRAGRSARRDARATCASCPASSPRPTCRCPAACSRCGDPTSSELSRDRRADRLGVEPVLSGDAPHGVPLLRRRHQFLRPRLPHAARLRAPALPVARAAHRSRAGRQLHQPRRLRQHQLVLPCHRAPPQAVDHQQFGRRGGSAAARAVRRRVGAGAVGDRAARSASTARWPPSSPSTCSRRRSPTRYVTTPHRVSSPAGR